MLSLAGWLSDLWLGKKGENNVILAASEFDSTDILCKTVFKNEQQQREETGAGLLNSKFLLYFTVIEQERLKQHLCIFSLF